MGRHCQAGSDISVEEIKEREGTRKYGRGAHVSTHRVKQLCFYGIKIKLKVVENDKMGGGTNIE